MTLLLVLTILSQSSPVNPYPKPPPEVLKKSLTPEQFHVTQSCGTEPAFHNAFWNNHEAGIYVDVVSGEPLFSSIDKFDSGTGWPSFTKPLKSNIVEKQDKTLFMTRTEVRSKHGDSHLGHLFNDGPREAGGMRYCINSASLKFVPVSELAAKGYGEFLPLFGKSAVTPQEEIAVLAGGCFWGMEDILRKIPGVKKVEVGYTGGHVDNPKYDDTHGSKSGHAEAVKVWFDPGVLSYADLLEKWYFKMHDPTTLNRQGNDVGSQYRSAIFYSSEDQRKVAEAVTKKVDKSGSWKKPIVTQVVAASKWWPAEEYHQDYLVKHPGGYSCHYMRP